jgi:hypothetical protein
MKSRETYGVIPKCRVFAKETIDRLRALYHSHNVIFLWFAGVLILREDYFLCGVYVHEGKEKILETFLAILQVCNVNLQSQPV